MKGFTIIAASVLFSCISFNSFSQDKDVKQVSSDNSNQPYKVGATNISIGNPVYAQKVLWFWKYFDNNTLEKVDNLLADDIIAGFPDGSSIVGKDNFMKASKDYRNSLSSAVSEVFACVTLKSPDNPQIEVVSIWGLETDTAKDGTVTKNQLNEVWYFNSQGKVVLFQQWAAKVPSNNK